MTRAATLILALCVTSCSLGVDLQGGYAAADAGRDLNGDAAVDAPQDTPPDLGTDDSGDEPNPDAREVDIPDVPDVADTGDATDAEDAGFICDGEQLELCPEGPDLNTMAVGCDDAGACLYDCSPEFRNVDDQPGCECPYSEEEICDGLDNNCDGTPDEGLDAELCRNQQGVCEGSVAGCGEGVVACDAEVYTRFAQGTGRVYDEAELEILCDGHDNNCDGETDDACCEPLSAWTPVSALSDAHSQAAPSIAVRGDIAAAAWIEIGQGEIADVHRPTGLLRYAYFDEFGALIVGPHNATVAERSSLPDIERSHRANRFVVARAAYSRQSNQPVELRQLEVHNSMLKGEAVVFTGGTGDDIDGVDQAHLGGESEEVLVAWSVRPFCIEPGCGTVYARAVNWDDDVPGLGARQTVSEDGTIASAPRMARVGERILLAYRYDRMGPNQRRQRGLRWQVFVGQQMLVGATGEFALNPTLDEPARDWEVFPYDGKVGIVIPAPPNGQVRFLVVDPADPAAAQVHTLDGAGPATVAAGFGSGGTGALMWWSTNTAALEFSTVAQNIWSSAPPLRTGDLGTPRGVAAVRMQRWGLVASTSKTNPADASRLEITAVNLAGARLCEP
jgi:hypothetical protein